VKNELKVSHLYDIAISVLLALSQQQQHIVVELLQSTVFACVALLLNRDNSFKLGLVGAATAILHLQFEKISSGTCGYNRSLILSDLPEIEHRHQNFE